MILVLMGRAGAGMPSANRITLLRDTDGDGVADTRSVFISKLKSPFGMALVGNDFYVADADAVMKFPYHEGDTKVHRAGCEAGRPAGRHHQSSLDQGHHRKPRRHEALCNRRLQQQCRRERHRGREGPRRRARSRSRKRQVAGVCFRPAQSQRPVMATASAAILRVVVSARPSRVRTRMVAAIIDARCSATLLTLDTLVSLLPFPLGKKLFNRLNKM